MHFNTRPATQYRNWACVLFSILRTPSGLPQLLYFIYGGFNGAALEYFHVNGKRVSERERVIPAYYT